VRPEEPAAHFNRQRLSHGLHGETRRIRGEHRILGQGLDHTEQQVLLHVEALDDRFTVLWVDPPSSALRHVRAPDRAAAVGLNRIGPGRWRLHTVTTPGPSRPVLREFARHHQAREVRGAMRTLARSDAVVVVADPWADSTGLPVSGTVFLCTDDFVAGAELMGVDRTAVSERVRRTVAAADVTLAVSPTLAGTLGGPPLACACSRTAALR